MNFLLLKKKSFEITALWGVDIISIIMSLKSPWNMKLQFWVVGKNFLAFVVGIHINVQIRPKSSFNQERRDTQWRVGSEADDLEIETRHSAAKGGTCDGNGRAEDWRSYWRRSAQVKISSYWFELSSQFHGQWCHHKCFWCPSSNNKKSSMNKFHLLRLTNY